jgi:hypothetical protein
VRFSVRTRQGQHEVPKGSTKDTGTTTAVRVLTTLALPGIADATSYLGYDKPHLLACLHS